MLLDLFYKEVVENEKHQAVSVMDEGTNPLTQLKKINMQLQIQEAMEHIIWGCIHIQNLAGLKKSKESSTRLVFGDLSSHPDGCRRSPPFADFVDFILIGNHPPWHLPLVINMSHARFWLHSGTGASATVKPESRFVHFSRSRYVLRQIM